MTGLRYLALLWHLSCQTGVEASIQVSPSSISETGLSSHTKTITLTNPSGASVVVDIAVSGAASRRLVSGNATIAAVPLSHPKMQAVSPPQRRVGAKRVNASGESCGSANRLLLRFKEGAQPHRSSIRKQMSHEVGLLPNGWRTLNYVNVEIIDLDCEAGAVPLEVMHRLQSVYGDDIEQIELDGRVHVTTQTTPTDPYWDDQWGMERVQVEEAWSRLHDLGVATTGVRETVVAVIDTGIDADNSDLTNMLWTNPGEIAGNGIDDDGNGYIDDVSGFNFADSTADVTDGNGHGTHCAGVIAAQANNGVGVAGVASQYANVKIMALKFIEGGDGSVSDAVEAINYAVANGAAISSNSYGVVGGGQGAFTAALESAEAAGHLFVAAGGNEATNMNENRKTYPCCVLTSNNICVASTTSQDSLSSFSNYGDTFVHMAAPGSQILSTYHTSDVATLSGTSMATPLVAGAAALVHSALDFVTALEIRSLLLSSAEELTALDNGITSHGLLDVEELVKVTMGEAPWLMLPAAENPFLEEMQVTVDAGSSIEVTLQVGHAYLAAGDYSGSVDFRWDGGSASVPVDFALPAKASFVTTDLQVDFGTCIGALAGCTAMVQLTNVGSVAGSFQVGALPEPFSAATTDIVEVAAASSATVEVFCAGAGSGTWASIATIRTTGDVDAEASVESQLQAGTVLNVSLMCTTVAAPKLEIDTYSGAAVLGSDGSLSHFTTSVPSEWEGYLNSNVASVTAILVLPPAGAEQGCSAYSDDDADTLLGTVVLVQRGTCFFYLKALYAQQAGALGVLLYDTEELTTLKLLSLPYGAPSPSIPTFMISNAEGRLLLARLMHSEIVVVLNWKPVLVRTGTDRSGAASIAVTNAGAEAFDWSASFEVSFGADNSQFYELSYPGSRNGEAPVFDLRSDLTSLLGAFADLDESAVQLNMGTILPYFGRKSEESVVISLNGLIYFDNQHNTDDWNAQLLSSSFESKAFFAPFAADYVCTGSSCDISVGVAEDASSGDFAIVVQFKKVLLFQAQDAGDDSALVTYEARMWKNGTFQVVVEEWPEDMETVDMPEVGLEDWVAGFGVSIERALPLTSGSAPVGITYTPWLAPDWNSASLTVSPGQTTTLPLAVYGRDSRQGWATITAERASDTWSWQATRRVRIVHEALSFSWTTSDWSVCVCGGLRTRVVGCVGSDGNAYDNSYCEAEQCRDQPFGWRDVFTYSCLDHEVWDWCTSDGGYGEGWGAEWATFAAYANRGYQADTACCVCGGGLQPTAMPASSETCTSEDTDDDGTCDLEDECPTDAGKTAPGICGCGVADPCPPSTSSTTSTYSSTSGASSTSTSYSSTSVLSTTSSSQSSTSGSSSTPSSQSTTSGSSSTPSSQSTTSGSSSTSSSQSTTLGSSTTSSSQSTTLGSSTTSSSQSSTSGSGSTASGQSTTSGSSITASGGSSASSLSTLRSTTSSSITGSSTVSSSSTTSFPSTSSRSHLASLTTSSSLRGTTSTSSFAGSSWTSTTLSHTTASVSTSAFPSTSSSHSSSTSIAHYTSSGPGRRTTSFDTGSIPSSTTTAAEHISSARSTSTSSPANMRTSTSTTGSTSTNTRASTASLHTSTVHSARSSSQLTITTQTTAATSSLATTKSVHSPTTSRHSSGATTMSSSSSSSLNPEEATSGFTSSSSTPRQTTSELTETTVRATSSSARTRESSSSTSSPSTASSTTTTTTGPPVLQISGTLEVVVDNCTAVANDDAFKTAVAEGIASTVSVSSTLVTVDAILCNSSDQDGRRLALQMVSSSFTISAAEDVDLEATSAELAVVNASVVASNMAVAFEAAGVETQILAVADLTAIVVEVTQIEPSSSSTSSASSMTSSSSPSSASSTRTSAFTSTSLVTSATSASTASETVPLLQDVERDSGQFGYNDMLAWLVPLALFLAVLGCIAYRCCVVKQAAQPRWLQVWRTGHNERRPPGTESSPAWQKGHEKDPSTKYETRIAEEMQEKVEHPTAYTGCVTSCLPKLEKPAPVSDSGNNNAAIDID